MSVVLHPSDVQVVLRYSGGVFVSGGAATVLGFNVSSSTLGSADDLAQQVGDAWEENLGDQTFDVITLDSVYWQGPSQSGEVSMNVPGGRGGSMATPNTAFLTSYSTLFKGPRGRGRSYWPGMLNDEDVTDSGTITEARMTALQTAFDGFFEDALANGVIQVILQRDEPGQQSEPFVTSPEVQSISLRSRAATQRRRLRR